VKIGFCKSARIVSRKKKLSLNQEKVKMHQLMNRKTNQSHAPVSTDSVSAVYGGQKKNCLKIKEINGS
jgi:microcompartment protein CcmK/EutM